MARLAAVVEREVERQHGVLLEEVRHLRTENARLESDNRKLRIKDEAIEETLRQLRQGTHAIYYDANGVRRTFAEVAG
jgi:hypothetical protein